MISAVGPEGGPCPDCGKPSKRRHSRYFRHLQDLPVQGAVVTVKMRMSLKNVNAPIHISTKTSVSTSQLVL